MKLVKLTYDVLRGINTTVWEASPTLKKTEKIIKTGLSGADVLMLSLEQVTLWRT